MRGRFLIAGSPVNLTRKEQIINYFRAQRGIKILRIKVIILYSISRLKEDGILKTFNSMDSLQLNLQRKGGREALKIVLGRIGALRLQEQLMGILVGKGAELVFNARAIARTAAVNHSCKEGRAVKAAAKNVMNHLIRMKEIAVHLMAGSLNGGGNIQKRKTLRIGVSFLNRKPGQIQGADIDPGRRPRLHPGRRNSEGGKLVGNSIRSFLSNSASFERMLANKHLPVKEGAGSQNNRLTTKNCPGNCLDAADFLILKEKIFGKIRVKS